VLMNFMKPNLGGVRKCIRGQRAYMDLLFFDCLALAFFSCFCCAGLGFSPCLSRLKMWRVPESLMHASQSSWKWKFREKRTTFSDPLLSSYSILPVFVQKILIRVPFSLAVANREPS
jgi:hypothetical protein